MKKLLQQWRDLRLAVKFSILTGIMVISTVLILTVLLIEREKNSFRADLEDNAAQLLNTIAYNVRTPLLNLEQDELDSVADVVHANPNITQVRIYGNNGRVLAITTGDEVLLEVSDDPLVYDILESDSEQIIYQWEDSQLIAGRISKTGNQKLGAVIIGLSTQPLDERIANFQQYSIGTAIVIVLISVILTYLLSRQINRPIQTLSGAAQKMAEGDLTVRVSHYSTDEVGQLTSAFNVMVGELQKREQVQRDFAAALEHRVRERTAELLATTSDLRKSNSELEQLNQDLDEARKNAEEARKNAEEARKIAEEARKNAEEASRLKSEFLASISHELRTPLNAVIGFSQLMLRGVGGELNEKHKQNIERIESNGNHLLELINNLLDLAKIEAGRTELVIAPFNVREIVNEVKHQTQGLVDSKQLALTVKVEADMPEFIKGDGARIKQILINLVSNAVKFTEEGSVTVQVSRPDENHWKLMVQDTGVGIPPHALEYIFDEFRQVDGGSTRQFGGTGLGLAIVRNLTSLMNGTVNASSRLNEGSTFTVTLPLDIVTTPSVAETMKDD